MMVKVYNDNVHPYEEKFKDSFIQIRAGGYVEMDHNEASEFLGTNPGIAARGADELQDPKTYKKLRIERPDSRPQADTQKETFRCMACNKQMYNRQSLEAHVEEYHAEALIDESEKEKIAKKRGRPAKVVKDDTGTD